ncbi:unnamed protein product [Allacma fusca]|uniref:Uncharacterized protein n=1 Tax=Allacma fusca TaxID=39272 RepID=A0A8J2P6H2_9HEXA|nr:unnamed protein product [Allacma fusca]
MYGYKKNLWILIISEASLCHWMDLRTDLGFRVFRSESEESFGSVLLKGPEGEDKEKRKTGLERVAIMASKEEKEMNRAWFPWNGIYYLYC